MTGRLNTELLNKDVHKVMCNIAVNQGIIIAWLKLILVYLYVNVWIGSGSDATDTGQQQIRLMVDPSNSLVLRFSWVNGIN